MLLRTGRRGTPRGRVMDNTREASVRKHFIMRAKERLDLRLTDRDYAAICGNIRNKTNMVVVNPAYTLRCRLVAVKYRNVWLPIVCCGDEIQTALQPEALEHFKSMLVL